MTTDDDLVPRYLGLVARSWHDPDFRERLRAHPREVLTASGWPIPAGAAITVITTRTLDILEQAAAWRDAAATGRYVLHLPLGAVQDLTDEQLESIVGGALATLAVLGRAPAPPGPTVVDELPPARP